MPNTCEKIQSFKIAFAKLQSEKVTLEKRFLEAADAERAAIVQEVEEWKMHADEIYADFTAFKEYTNRYENKETLWTMDDIKLWAKEQLGEDEDWVPEYFTETADGIICTKLLNLDNSNITTLPACTYTERVILGNCKKLKKIHNATFTFLVIDATEQVSLQNNVYGTDGDGDSLFARNCKGLVLDGAKFEGFVDIDGSENPSLQNVVYGKNNNGDSLSATSCKGLVLDGAKFEGFVRIDRSENPSLQNVVYGKNNDGDSLSAMSCKGLVLDGAKFEGFAMIDGSENPSLQNVVWGVDLANNSLFARKCTNLDTFTLTQKVPGNVDFTGSTHTPHFLETIKKYKADGMIEGMLTLPDGTVIP